MASLPPIPSAPEHLKFWETHLHCDERYYVYVIRAYDGSIKIGKARNPESRMRTFQTAHVRPLEMLYVVPGRAKMEQALQAQAADFRERGEWFVGEQIGEFLRWMHDFCEQAVEDYWKSGYPPKPPAVEQRVKANIAHRWRSAQPST